MGIKEAEEIVLSGLEDRSTIPVSFETRPRCSNQDEVRLGAVPTYVDTIYITKYVDRLNTRCAPAKQSDFEKYPKQYQAFLAKKEQMPTGTPIDNLPGLTPSQKENLRARKVYTLERLVECNHTVLSEIGYGALDLQTRAKEYLQQSKLGNGEELKAAQAEIEQLKKMIMEMKDEPSNNSTKRSKRNVNNTKSDNGSNE